jgi:glycosyltransferase involved in cell wall biosynthesis
VIKKKVLIVTTEFPPLPGGIGNHAFHLSKNLVQNGYIVIVLTELRSDTIDQWNLFVSENNDIEIIGIKRRSRIILTYFERVVKFIFLLLKHKPITIFSGRFSIWLASIDFFSQQKISIIHGSEIQNTGIWDKLFSKGLNNCSKIVSVSNYTEKKLLESYKIESSKLKVINNGFYFDSISQNSRKNINSQSEINFITVGGMHKRKGQQNFIAAIPHIIKEVPNIKYLIAGLPTEIEELKKQISDLDVAKYVEFYIAPSNFEIAELYKKAHFFIMLSENLENGDFEGFGIAILEGMSQGLPAIGSINTGIEDAISNKFSGMLVNPKSANEIVDAIKEMITNYSDYSLNAAKWSNNFKWEKVIEKYKTILEH